MFYICSGICKWVWAEFGGRVMATVNVFAKNSQGEIVPKQMRMGLIPASYSGRVADWTASTTHACVETAATLPSFEHAWRRKRRVIILVDRYFEKAVLESDLLGKKRKKRKVAISRADGKPMGVAGLYDYAVTLDGPILSAAMLTRAPGGRMSEIHDREPAVLEEKDWKRWLDGEDVDVETPWADNAFQIEAVN